MELKQKMGRPHGSCTTEKLLPSRRGFWDDAYDQEDAQKSGYNVSRTKTGNWAAAISKKTAGMGGRVERSSRARWSNNNNNNNNRSSRHDVDQQQQDNFFSPQEEELIIKLHATIGSRWSIIAQQLPGRTDNDVKNLWNTKLKKKLSAMGIDPVTHKPFSQILADYGNIGGGFPTGGTSCSSSRPQFGTLNRALKTTTIILSKSSAAAAAAEAEDCCFLQKTNKSSGGSSDYSNHQYMYMDLLSELQAIKSITESTTYTNYVHSSSPPDAIVSQPSSSLSSSSSLTSPLAAAQEKACTAGFSWCDFLLEDAFQQAADHDDWEPNNPADHNTSPQDIIKISSSSSNNNLEAAAASSSSSFVEAMLSRQDLDGMFLDFPAGLSDEEPFYY